MVQLAREREKGKEGERDWPWPRPLLHTCSSSPELCSHTMRDCQNGNGDSPFKGTPFCFHLTGYTNNLFISRRAGLDSLKVGLSVFQGKGSVSWHADRICAHRLLPDPIITWGKWARIHKTHRRPNHNSPWSQRSALQRLRVNSGSQKATLPELPTLGCELEPPRSFLRDAALWAPRQRGWLHRSGVQPGLHGFQKPLPSWF